MAMEPKQVECVKGLFNQVPPWIKRSGGIRLTPFCSATDAHTEVCQHVRETNETIPHLPTRGRMSKCTLLDLLNGEIKRGTPELESTECPWTKTGQ